MPAEPEVGPATPSAAEKKSRLRRLVAVTTALMVLILGAGVTVGLFYLDGVPTPAELTLPEATTVYYADGTTPMAKLGAENRTILSYDQMNDAVKQAVVAAEDQSFWSNKGVDVTSIMRAAWNNVSGGPVQGASTITQQYARLAADLKGVTYSRKLREAVIAWKLVRKYPKRKILEFYLNTVPFGRGTYGIEAAAQAFFGKTANRGAPVSDQLTVSEAMVLVAMIKQPERDPDDPEAHPGYDPTRGPIALANSRGRWAYVRDAMVRLRYLTPAQAARLQYPTTVKPFDVQAQQSGLDRPTGLVVSHVLSELRQNDPFRGKASDYIENGGFHIVTTIDRRLQQVAEGAADIRGPNAPEAVRGQPADWQAALVSVAPGPGRVLAYYGGDSGTGADYAGWYIDADGDPHGFGQHPPGSSFKVYDLAEALRQGISMRSVWDSPASKEFPESGRTTGSPAGPVRNGSTAACQPNCELWQATAASLNVTFFELTEKLGTANVIDMARKAGIDSMWTNQPDRKTAIRVDLRDTPTGQLADGFSTEVGIGQYGVTVLDHANGMATLAAGGKRATAHFVRSVAKGDDDVYHESLHQTDIGLSDAQINELDWTLNKVTTANLDNGWDSAGKTGTWQYGNSTTQNANTWMVGYTRPLAAAVWLGTKNGAPLVTKTGALNVYGSNYPGPIWQQYMRESLALLKLNPDEFRFGEVNFTPSAPPTQDQPPPPPPPPSSPSPSPSPSTCPPACPSPSLTLPTEPSTVGSPASPSPATVTPSAPG
jgi:membrane peptidoglycan carboxypeptidase